MATEVVALTRSGDVVVDFCAGSVRLHHSYALLLLLILLLLFLFLILLLLIPLLLFLFLIILIFFLLLFSSLPPTSPPIPTTESFLFLHLLPNLLTLNIPTSSSYYSSPNSPAHPTSTDPYPPPPRSPLLPRNLPLPPLPHPS